MAHDLAGALSVWSAVAERNRPGPLAETAAEVARSAQISARDARVAASRRCPFVAASNAILAATRSRRHRSVETELLIVFGNVARAIFDAHVAAGRAQAARALADVTEARLLEIHDRLAPPLGSLPEVAHRPGYKHAPRGRRGLGEVER